MFDRTVCIHCGSDLCDGRSDTAPAGWRSRLDEWAEDKKKLSKQTFYGWYLSDTFYNDGIAF